MDTTYHVTVSEKGQLVIPAELRSELGITKGTRLVVSREEGRLILQPITSKFIRSLRGKFKGSKALSYLLSERKKDRF
jgi:AbrB family looped-hinge helix DNA binding protein